MLSIYDQQWTCPICTLLNSNQNKKCSVCNFENKTKKPTTSSSNPNLTNGSKYSNMLKSALNTFSSDVKGLINSLNYNNEKSSASSSNSNNQNMIANSTHKNVNQKELKNNYINDEQDVIEIDPTTNKPINLNQNGKNYHLIPNLKTRTLDSWTCEACSYSTNPEWTLKCEMCFTNRDPNSTKKATNKPLNLKRGERISKENKEVKKDFYKNNSNQNRQGHEDMEDSVLTVYDESLNEDIYDYARIWTCKMCTYINFGKDMQCELCFTPRSTPQENQNDENKINMIKPSSSNAISSLMTPVTSKHDKKIVRTIKDKWVCKFCTYLNLSSDNRCILCSSLRKDFDDSNSINSTDLQKKINGNYEWSCEICSHKNKSNTNICIVCSNEKDKNMTMDVDYDNLEDNHYDNNYDDILQSSSISSNTLSRCNTLNASLTFRSQKAKSVIKTYTNATTQAERLWNNIVRYCKENGHKFVDDSFPPCDKSLFIDPNKKPENFKLKGGITWLCPESLWVSDEEYHLKWTVYNEPKFSDIKQGLLGNCWLLSALAVIIEQPEMLRKIIITKDYCPQGCYQVRLCHNGEWQTVIVDDLFPCDSSGSLIFSKASRRQLWVALIEKAAAKLNGSYESLVAGQTVEGLSTLTGYPCDSIRLEPQTSSNEIEDIDYYIIWARLLSMKEAGYAMGASCGRNDIGDDSVFTNHGLLPRHAYSIINVKEINGYQLLQLRNPWGRYTWQGDWSENSCKWTPELRKALGLKQKVNKNNHQNGHKNNDHDQGVFWISFDDFIKYFCSVDICKTRLDLFENRITGYFNSEGTREIQAYHLIVFDTCEIDIGLFHKSTKNRKENSDLDLSFVVLRSSGRRDSVGKLVVSSKRFVRKFIGCEHIFEAGEYLIVPLSFNFWYTSSISKKRKDDQNNSVHTSNNLYNIVVHSSKVFFLEQEMHSPFLLADTIIQLCLSKGSQTSSGLDNSCIYTLSKGWAGLIVIAENCNQDAYLHVQLDCECSNNVVSTRQTLITKDSVPPLHRQVLIVLTHLEGSNGYSIQYSIRYRQSSNPYLNTWPGNEGQMITNFPEINKQTFGLHAPRSVFI